MEKGLKARFFLTHEFRHLSGSWSLPVMNDANDATKNDPQC